MEQLQHESDTSIRPAALLYCVPALEFVFQRQTFRQITRKFLQLLVRGSGETELGKGDLALWLIQPDQGHSQFVSQQMTTRHCVSTLDRMSFGARTALLVLSLTFCPK